jgi:ribonuclease III
LPLAFGTSEELAVALTHDSYAAERARNGVVSNERLEFLGDAVLGVIVAHALFARHPDVPEGTLSRMRAALVSRPALARTAQRLELGPLILLGRGEQATGGSQRPSILSSAVEALVAAVFLHEGFETARRFVERHHLAHERAVSAPDPKTELQEYVQAKYKKAPHYAMTAQRGPAHARIFSATVTVAGVTAGSGEGPSLKLAQAAAARQALAKLRRADRT